MQIIYAGPGDGIYFDEYFLYFLSPNFKIIGTVFYEFLTLVCSICNWINKPSLYNKMCMFSLGNYAYSVSIGQTKFKIQWMIILTSAFVLLHVIGGMLKCQLKKVCSGRLDNENIVVRLDDVLSQLAA